MGGGGSPRRSAPRARVREERARRGLLGRRGPRSRRPGLRAARRPAAGVIPDANGGWRLTDAMTAARLLEGLPRLFFEQPCPTLEECLSVRRHTSLPFVLDEVITDVESFLRAWREHGMDAINL